MIISYVWVLETNTGATWRLAYLRIVRFDLIIEPFSHTLSLDWHYIGSCVRIPCE